MINGGVINDSQTVAKESPTTHGSPPRLYCPHIGSTSLAHEIGQRSGPMLISMVLNFLKTAEVVQSIPVIKTKEGVIALAGTAWLNHEIENMTLGDMKVLRDGLGSFQHSSREYPGLTFRATPIILRYDPLLWHSPLRELATS